MLQTELIAPVPELLRRHANERGAKIAYRDARSQVTFAELFDRTANIAGHLADNGVEPGDTVAIMLPNSVQWVEASRQAGMAEIATGAVSGAGCRFVITNGSLSAGRGTTRDVIGSGSSGRLKIGPADKQRPKAKESWVSRVLCWFYPARRWSRVK